jgi:tight adherence protein C
MSFIIALGVAVSVLLLVEGLRRYSKKPPIEESLAQYAMVGEDEARRSSFERRIRPLAVRIAPRFRLLQPLIQPRGTTANLAYAGDPLGLDLEVLLGVQILSGMLLGVLGAFAGFVQGPGVGLAVTIAFTAGGTLYPLVWLDSRAKERQQAITRAVPEALELLSISVQAGLNFDAAMTHLVQRLGGPLAEELGKFLQELRMGIPRREAYGRLLDRNNSEELHAIIGAISQAQELGVPIVKTLKEQADEMRTRRLQRAKEEGAKASPKIALVTTLLIAPSALCLMTSILLFHIIVEVGSQFSVFFGGGR